MNIASGTASYEIELDQVASLYFWEYFCKAFKEKKTLRSAHIICQSSLREVIGPCPSFLKNQIKQYLIDQKNLTKESSFQEIRKLLIQYYPIVKCNVFMVDITINDE